jgi:sec-independent protein translocase protein TatA
MGFSLTHLILLLLIVFVVFGAGKLPRVMGDIGKGVRNMREGLKGEDETAMKQIDQSKEKEKL